MEHNCHLKAVLTPIGVIKCQLGVQKGLKGTLNKNYSNVYEYYDGPYVVDPTFSTQELQTNQKLMDANVEIKPIFVSRTTNSAGGITVFIGGI